MATTRKRHTAISGAAAIVVLLATCQAAATMLGDAVFLPSVSQAAQAALATTPAGRTPRRAR
jgi:hypothetical protein